MRRFRPWLIVVGIIVALGAGAYVVHVRSGNAQSKTTPSGSGQRPRPAPVPVIATTARSADMAVYLSGLGSVTALNTVTVHTRVDGELTKVLFQEGQRVNAGDLLAEIDPRPFQAQLTQAQGSLLRDEALLRNARVDLERYRTLVAEDSIPKQQLDTQVELVHQYEGVVETDRGQIENVKLQLVYCRITAPLSGRLGLRLVDPGNIVHATDQNGLVVITQVQPIAVVFTIPEDSLPPVLAKLNAGVKLEVDAWDRDQKQRLATGTLLTVDNQIDPTTGTVRLKAIFPNADARLFPSQFVNAHLRLDVKRGATVVPQASIQPSSQGPFVYVVKADHSVTVRPVKVGVTEGENAAIDSGLSPGEMVVVDGADRLREGSQVALQNPSGSPPVARREP
jgi:membrane fusion protein, multidrug efflux system